MDGAASCTAGARTDLGRRRPLKVLKFGGSSLSTPERLRCVSEIIARASLECDLVVVVSAVGRTTDVLACAIDGWARGESVEPAMEEIRRSHLELAGAVLSGRGLDLYRRVAAGVVREVRWMCAAPIASDGFGVDRWNGGEPAELAAHRAQRDFVLAAGERLSAPLVALALEETGVSAQASDAAALIATDDNYGDARVREGETFLRMSRWIAEGEPETVRVVTGFIGAAPDGSVTTLGRGGSDYSAALFARGLGAAALERWTDIDGLYTADPRRVEGARRFAAIALSEAVHLNRAGRFGMHARALDPLVEAAIPVYVRSTTAPELPGTLIVPAVRDYEHSAAG